jgi:predicted dehydrogenase
MTIRSPLRIGILGAARIAPMALIRPAAQVPGVRVAAVAARDFARAKKFAAKHGIETVHASYQELLADPEVDAVYNPLPNGLHCEWSVRALEAGKHVLCEKPLASNASEAEQMADAAARSGRVLAEAFHWRYHPLSLRAREIVASGELGALRHVEASLCIPLPFPNDIRYRLDLAGGATMDTGCYTINMVRVLSGAEPDVVSAVAKLRSPQVDRWMQAELVFPSGATGRITCSLFSSTLMKISARVVGERGELRIFNPIAPHLFGLLTVKTAEGTRRERGGGDATYTHQLRAFSDWVAGGPAMPSDAADAVANMRVIDAVYRAAGLQPRGIATAPPLASKED